MEFHKYPKIRRLGHAETQGIWYGSVIVEEKIDGANFRFVYDSELNKVRWGSRNVDYINVSQENWPKNFEKQWKWVFDNEEALQLYPNYIFYAEAVIPHTIQYDWKRFKAPLIGFDVLDPSGKWVPYPKNKEIFKEIGLPFVPVITIFEEKPSIEDFSKLIPKSEFYDGTAEGVVLKNYDKGLFAKVLSEKFKEVNRSIFGKSKKELKDETDRWFEYMFSPRRIEKTIQRLVDEGYNLDMRMMKDLIYNVMQDAVEEEGFELIRKANVVDFNSMRKMLSRRCQNILQRMIAMKSLE